MPIHDGRGRVHIHPGYIHDRRVYKWEGYMHDGRVHNLPGYVHDRRVYKWAGYMHDGRVHNLPGYVHDRRVYKGEGYMHDGRVHNPPGYVHDCRVYIALPTVTPFINMINSTDQCMGSHSNGFIMIYVYPVNITTTTWV